MIVFEARHYDGLSSEATEVRVEVDDANVMRIFGLPEPCELPAAEVRIEPRLGSTSRKITLPGGAICETNAHEALDELSIRTGTGRFFRLVHQLESTWRAAVFATLVLVLVVAGGIRWGIPVLAKHVAAAIPPRMAYDLGQGTLAMLDRTMLKPTQLTEERRAELALGFEKLADAYPELPLELNFRRGVGPNAFALPDGSVIVTDELVSLAKDDNEIFGVLMHEIGHVHHRHALRMALESSTVVILVSTYLGDITQLSTLSTTMPGIIAQSNYSRDHETEADSFALEYMDRSRISRKHYANILRALQGAVGKDSEGGFQYIASHPPTAERIRRFEQ